MKTKILFLFAWFMATATGCSTDEPRKDLPDTPPVEKPKEPVAPASDRKVQIVYFSHTGNTRTVAGYIHDIVESDMVELKTKVLIPMITIRCWRKSVKRSPMSIVRRLRHASKTYRCMTSFSLDIPSGWKRPHRLSALHRFGRHSDPSRHL